MKQKISKYINETEQRSPVLEKLRQEDQGFKVPDGYFDSLSPRIVDSIKKQEYSSLDRVFISPYRKPLVWKSIMAVMLFAAMIISFILVKKESVVLPVFDEWAEMNMAYDESYAEEVYLAESNTIDNELENKDIDYYAIATVTTVSEPTEDEITEYLKDQEIETDILNEY